MTNEVIDICKRAAACAPRLAGLETRTKNNALVAMAEALLDYADELTAANTSDRERAAAEGTSETMLDRLTLGPSRLASMAGGLRAVGAQDDPVGEVVSEWKRPNGLTIEQVRAPLGVVAVIYEGRPNVTSDVAGLCLKSGNASVLRGSSAALDSNRAIVGVLREALRSSGIEPDAVQLIPDPGREAALELMKAKGLVDLLVPRGGAALIASIEAHATVPFIIDGDGNCHIYVDSSADEDIATAIVVNAKTQRPSVCNALETLVVHEGLVGEWLPAALDELSSRGSRFVATSASSTSGPRRPWPRSRTGAPSTSISCSRSRWLVRSTKRSHTSTPTAPRTRRASSPPIAPALAVSPPRSMPGRYSSMHRRAFRTVVSSATAPR